MATKRYVIVAHAFDAKGRLISVATNSYEKTHPMQAYFAEKVGHSQRIFLHAEIQALLRCKDRKVHSLKVWRYGVDGTFRCAKPCPICMEAIKAFGVQQVWYSDIGNQMVSLSGQ